MGIFLFEMGPVRTLINLIILVFSIRANFPLRLGPGGPRLWQSEMYKDFESGFIPDLETLFNAEGGNRKYVRALETTQTRRSLETFLVLDIGCENGCFQDAIEKPLRKYIEENKYFGIWPVSLHEFKIKQYPAKMIELPANGQRLINNKPCEK